MTLPFELPVLFSDSVCVLLSHSSSSSGMGSMLGRWTEPLTLMVTKLNVSIQII